MRLRFCTFYLVALSVLFAISSNGKAVAQADSSAALHAALTLPEAPQPQVAATAADDGTQQAAQQQNPPATTGSSSSQAQATETDSEKARRDKADQQVREQEHQRVLGILPAFNTSYRSDAVSLTAKQKISLAFHSSVDPVTFAASAVVAGLHEALDDDTGFGWGAEGYGKRWGAAYLDSLDGTMIGNGFLPALLRQDPRYFRLGHGSTTHRLLYAAATTVICKHDNTGKWEPNYSNVGGNIIAGAISNYYYPSQNSGFGETISNGMIVTAEGTFGSVFQEFWPDVSRKLFHKDPTRGLDAQVRAADAAAKQARQTQPLPAQK